MDKGVLRRLETPSVVAHAKQLGPYAFIGPEIEPINIASKLTEALLETDQKVTNLLCFFTASIRSDDSYLSVSFEVGDINPTIRYVFIRRRIKFLSLTHVRNDVVVDGPLVDREAAAELVELLNKTVATKRPDVPCPYGGRYERVDITPDNPEGKEHE